MLKQEQKRSKLLVTVRKESFRAAFDNGHNVQRETDSLIDAYLASCPLAKIEEAWLRGKTSALEEMDFRDIDIVQSVRQRFSELNLKAVQNQS